MKNKIPILLAINQILFFAVNHKLINMTLLMEEEEKQLLIMKFIIAIIKGNANCFANGK